eukprot:gene23139-31456_t
MPAYHSKRNDDGYEEVCGCAICPLKSEIKGIAAPFVPVNAEDEDIIDETLNYFRANVLFRNFDVRGSADKTLIYLTLHTVQCLVKCEKIEDKATAIKELRALSTKQFALPGEPTFPLAGLMNTPVTKAEGDAFKAYFKQAREELSLRLCDRLFEKDGTKSKWWQSFSKKKFMGKEMKD